MAGRPEILTLGGTEQPMGFAVLGASAHGIIGPVGQDHKPKKDLEQKIKMIWDFRGPGAERTAEHHRDHLEEYATMEKLEYVQVGVEHFGEFHSTAFMVVGESQVQKLREILKPHRGQRHTG